MSTSQDHPEELSDDLIARVLTGLRDTQPSPGMNDRILHTLQLHTAAAHAREPRAAKARANATRTAPNLHRPWILAVAALTAALIVAALISSHSHHSQPSTAHSSRPQIIPTAPAPARIALAQPIHALHIASIKQPKSSTPLAITPPSTDPEAAEALADTLAPSHPAPPLPLTPQEKLLLRVLQLGDPVELAQLDPMQRDASLARDQAEYQRFFPPPPPPPLPQDPTSAEISAPAPAQIPTAPSSGDQP